MELHVARLIAFILLAGCATTKVQQVPPTPQVSSICLDHNQTENVRKWGVEACKRLRDPVVVFCHGQGSLVWMCYPEQGPPLPVEAVARILHALYPTRDVLLITCNPFGKSLDVPRVWYAQTIVWCEPGTRWRWSEGRMLYGAGQIWDFKTGK